MEACEGETGEISDSGSWLTILLRNTLLSSDVSAGESDAWLALASASPRDFLIQWQKKAKSASCSHEAYFTRICIFPAVCTNFLLLLSVTTHSTWSSRQFVQGEPFSTTSQRTFRARQQQHAFEARLFTGRAAPGKPAVEALRLFCVSVSVTVAMVDTG